MKIKQSKNNVTLTVNEEELEKIEHALAVVGADPSPNLDGFLDLAVSIHDFKEYRTSRLMVMAHKGAARRGVSVAAFLRDVGDILEKRDAVTVP